MAKRKRSVLARDSAAARPPRPPPATPPTPSPAARARPPPHKPASPIHAAAAAALDRLLAAADGAARGASLKTLTLGAARALPRPKDRRAVHAVASGVLREGGRLAAALAEAGAWPPPARVTRGAALVLAYELTLGTRRLRGVGAAEKAVLAVADAVREAVGRGGAGAAAPARHPPHPRAVRVNTLAWPVPAALAALAPLGATHDPVLADVLLLPPGTDVHAHPDVARGALVLQSRASALPAAALAPEVGWTVVDGTAAPGNKTTQLAAMVGPTGRVIAYDRDPARLALLTAAVARAGAGRIVDARCADFLSIDPAAALPAVDAVLLDPSCSGSGTAAAGVDAALAAVLAVGRGEGDGGGAAARADARVARLASFQLAALRHALSFPGARRVAYSTCSVHAAENEAVVAAALDGGGDGDAAAAPPARAAGWRLATALPAWPTRGRPGAGLSDEEAGRVLRADPAADMTDGFFTAVFERDAV